jgi:hypothetical protein
MLSEKPDTSFYTDKPEMSSEFAPASSAGAVDFRQVGSPDPLLWGCLGAPASGCLLPTIFIDAKPTNRTIDAGGFSVTIPFLAPFRRSGVQSTDVGLIAFGSTGRSHFHGQWLHSILHMGEIAMTLIPHRLRPGLTAVLFVAALALAGPARAGNPIKGEWTANTPMGITCYYFGHRFLCDRHEFAGRFSHSWIDLYGGQVVIRGTYVLHGDGPEVTLDLLFDNFVRFTGIPIPGNGLLPLWDAGTGATLSYARAK